MVEDCRIAGHGGGSGKSEMAAGVKGVWIGGREGVWIAKTK